MLYRYYCLKLLGFEHASRDLSRIVKCPFRSWRYLLVIQPRRKSSPSTDFWRTSLWSFLFSSESHSIYGKLGYCWSPIVVFVSRTLRPSLFELQSCSSNIWNSFRAKPRLSIALEYIRLRTGATKSFCRRMNPHISFQTAIGHSNIRSLQNWRAWRQEMTLWEHYSGSME